MASRLTAIRFAEKLLTPENVEFLSTLINHALQSAMKAGNVARTAELIDLKKYADALAPKSEPEATT